MNIVVKFNDQPYICPSTTRYYPGNMILLLPSTLSHVLSSVLTLFPPFSLILAITLDISVKTSKSPTPLSDVDIGKNGPSMRTITVMRPRLGSPTYDLTSPSLLSLLLGDCAGHDRSLVKAVINNVNRDEQKVKSRHDR